VSTAPARGPARWGAALALAALASSAPTRAAGAPGFVCRLAERGPATFVVGLAFTLASPFALARGAVTGGRSALHACRLGHGMKMLAAGALTLPAGLLVSPFDAQRLPDGWMDGIVDAFQEDYCTRPLRAVYP
jgi:hypothetical protein